MKRIRSILIVTTMALAMILITSCQGNNADNQQEAIAVEVYEVKMDEIQEKVTLAGQLMPSNNAMIIARQPGLKVTNLAVKLGDRVKDGDFLFELDKTLIRKQVEQAKENYEFARENLRLQKLSIEEMEKQAGELEALQEKGGLLKVFNNNALPNISNNLGGDEILRGAEIQVEQARQVYSNSIQLLSELEYHAPIEGIVSQLNIQKSQAFLGNGPALIISNTDELKISINVTKDLLNHLSIGDDVLVKYEESTKKGVIKVLNPVGDPRSGLYLAEISINNGDNKLSAGSYVLVEITKEYKDRAIVIPKEAVIQDQEGTHVYIGKDQKSEKRAVDIGIMAEDTVEILNGIELGDQVIVKGQHFLQEDSLILIRGEEIEAN
ncbi:efflux RND transporter periplasmic adaptor subunit [Alkaliphilus serpentinus]|uniref:Efflux RND transporter periplasmic adaptor subunit n=1 Tax=Alkaliphilus serpentinus TaxID=1482731 RepID=A0A833HRB2_9FIRM|nr:efflux RND transporter periplasmic adaptor subunit [Alkaliphilus serpentinus]KAB3533089.1 efflux RND transporter periplasmic adaptor subunit [Alkaliphilus serpentinus]